MEPYKEGDAVRILTFSELEEMDPQPEELTEEECYGIASFQIDSLASRGVVYISKVDVDDDGNGYRLVDESGNQLPFWWLHCMLDPVNTYEDDDPVFPESSDGLFGFLLV